MTKQEIVRRAARVSVLGLFGVGLTIAGTQISLANCGGHCQVMKRCVDLVKEKGTKRPEFRTEYNKCMADPENYK